MTYCPVANINLDEESGATGSLRMWSLLFGLRASQFLGELAFAPEGAGLLSYPGSGRRPIGHARRFLNLRGGKQPGVTTLCVCPLGLPLSTSPRAIGAQGSKGRPWTFFTYYLNIPLPCTRCVSLCLPVFLHQTLSLSLIRQSGGVGYTDASGRSVTDQYSLLASPSAPYAP